MNWLDSLVKQHEDTESPLSFWRWAGIFSVSAVLRDNVWLSRGGLYDLYPNLYVMFHADSGLKKGPPINLAKKLIKEVKNTRVISGRSSVQAILKELGTAYSMPGGEVMNRACGVIISSELSASIVTDPAATGILTDIFDGHYHADGYKSLLKNEEFKLESPTVGMLSGTNESMSDDFFTKKDVSGGFLARTCVIYASKRNKINSLVNDLENPPDIKELSKYLKELSKLRGPFKKLGNTDAGNFYDQWYKDFTTTVDAQEIKDTTGTLNRFGDTVLKLAMILSLIEKPELEITLEGVENAIEICQPLVGNIRRTTMSRGKDAMVTEKAALIQLLLNRDNHMISVKQLHKQLWMHGTAESINDLVNSLVAAEILRIEAHGNTQMIVMPEKVVKEFSKHFRGEVK